MCGGGVDRGGRLIKSEHFTSCALDVLTYLPVAHLPHINLLA